MEHSLQLQPQLTSSTTLDAQNTETSSLSKSLVLPARKTQFGFSITKPIKLLVLSLKPKDEQFYLTQAAKNHLESLDGECYVISVSGSPMIGKSSLLDLLLTFFIGSDVDISRGEIPYQEIYPTGNGKKPTTDGIDMYCISVQGKNFIFLDIEGDNDPTKKETGVWIDTNLLQTAIGASHAHIYNFLKFPQKSFLDYFESISKVVKQNHVHSEFEAKYVFLKRDDPISEKDMLPQEMEEYKTEYEEVVCKDLDYSLHLLPMPPRHITQRKSKASCITSTGSLCKDCQNHIFISMLLDLKNELISHLNQVRPFKSGHHVSKALEQLVEINKRELPFFSDGGHIEKMRLDKFKKEQVRIQDGLLKLEPSQTQDNSLYKEFKKVMSDHPNLVDEELCESFSARQVYLSGKITQIGYIIPELIEQYLLEEKASILNETEKQALWDAYVAHFEELSRNIIRYLKEYHEMTESICKSLSDIKNGTEIHLNKYKSARSETFNKVLALLADLAGSGALKFLSKEITQKMIAAVFVGGGLVGTAFTAYFFIQACHQLSEAWEKNEASLNSEKVGGIDDEKRTKGKMEIIEEFVKQLVDDIERSRETLKEVCLDEAHENFQLIENMKEVMEQKVKGMSLSANMRAELIQGMAAAEKNLQRFEKCL